MNYQIDRLQLAIVIATNAHKNQVDKAGNSYIEHPMRVMNAVEGDAEKQVAILHVYYFYQEPKGFSGGDLVLYGKGSNWQDSREVIEPINNSIVLFDSGLMHEVLPVSCPSKDWQMSRSSINGWVRK